MPRKVFNVHEAKTHFSKLLAQVAKGKTVTIAKAGKPVATLSPVKTVRSRPKFGYAKGSVGNPEAAAEPMSPEEIALFEDGPIFTDE